MHLVFIILFALSAGCSSVSERTSADIPPAATAAMKRLYVGMPEGEASEIMKPVSLNWGRAVSGGTGNGALIFQLSDTKQVRIEVDLESHKEFEPADDMKSLLKIDQGLNQGPQWFVREIGKPEPKTTWRLDANHYFK
jgi:hypothetical protein